MPLVYVLDVVKVALLLDHALFTFALNSFFLASFLTLWPSPDAKCKGYAWLCNYCASND